MSERSDVALDNFVLDGVPALSRTTVVRDELLRAYPERLRHTWPGAGLVRMDPEGRVVVRDGALVVEQAGVLGAEPTKDAVLLGEDSGRPVWAVPVPELEVGRGEEAAELRGSGAELDATGAGLLTTATALLAWHQRARFCAWCGGRTKPISAGWARRCTPCGHEEYPRTDAAVICLVHDGGDQVLLARQPTWPEGRYSVLAGFVEAGESLEACVVREVGEEVGVHVTDLHYLGSQPWPFPRSIMIGFHARADAEAPVVPRDGEIAEARWYTREQVRAALAEGEWTGDPAEQGPSVPLLLPGSVSIARRMLESWVSA